jgi:hypothetical protein
MSKRKKRRKRKPELQAPPERRQPRPPSRDERVLGERIERFASRDRFRADFRKGIQAFFGSLDVDEEHFPAFMDWYIYDRVAAAGVCIIDLFAEEVGSRLPAAQQRILDDTRRTNRYHLLEVEAVEPGVGVTAKDLLDGEVYRVGDVSCSYSLLRWEVILARLVEIGERVSFSGDALSFPPRYKAELETHARGLWSRYQKRHPRASQGEFYRSHGLDLRHYILEIASRPPSLYTPEGHSVMLSIAVYGVKDPEEVHERLDEAVEFEFTGLDEEENALIYGWMQRGRSHVPRASVAPEDGVIVQGSLVPFGSDEEPVASLGSLKLWPNRLELQCSSQERLKAGKALLREILGRLIRHGGDEAFDLADLMEQDRFPVPPPPDEPLGQLEREIAQQMADEMQNNWPDESVPALGGMTPREAARDPAMRERLEEILKSIEYEEEHKRRKGEPCADVAAMRREMGLPAW